MTENPDAQSSISREDRKAALSYYELHVTHRSHLFNLMLVMVAAAALAFTTALDDDSDRFAGVIAVLTGLVILAFLGVNEVTLTKIDGAKDMITGGCAGLKDVYGQEAKVLGLSDRSWKRAIHGVLAAAFFTGAYAAFDGHL